MAALRTPSDAGAKSASNRASGCSSRICLAGSCDVFHLTRKGSCSAQQSRSTPSSGWSGTKTRYGREGAAPNQKKRKVGLERRAESEILRRSRRNWCCAGWRPVLNRGTWKIAASIASSPKSLLDRRSSLATSTVNDA